mgnify:CR=1 FL=1
MSACTATEGPSRARSHGADTAPSTAPAAAPVAPPPPEAPPAQAAAPAPGEVAQRTLGAGSMLRAGDTAPPEVVLRGETVTIVYETPGVSLSMRGQANESGRLGATVSVLNVASKKALQATVIGPGRVSVGPAAPVRQASAALDTP